MDARQRVALNLRRIRVIQGISQDNLALEANVERAYERGVKPIGATAHYVTADLDEGPIIEQDTARITHAQSADDYVSIGRDVESQVLARAIHAHIHHRTFINGNRTIVFPASPGSFASERMG